VIFFVHFVFILTCRCERTLYPADLKNFIEKYEAVTTSGNSSKGEGLDAQLEEVNKASKCWENGAMTAREWLTIFRNHDELAKVTFFQSGFNPALAGSFHILTSVVFIIFPKVYFKPKNISTLFPRKTVGYIFFL